MLKKLFQFSLCVLIAGCSSKDQMMSEQAHMYEDFKTSNSSSSMFRIGESMKKAGNFDTAINLYEQTLQMDPTFLPAHLSLSQCLRFTGRPEAALEVLKAVPADSQNVSYYKELGSVMAANQKPKDCVSAYMKAYEADANDLGTLNGIAVCYDLDGQHEDAHKWYQTAMNLAPAHNNLRSNYGLSLALSGQTEEAITLLRSVAYGKDATSRDRQNLAIALGLSGDMDAAAKLFAHDLDENAVRTNLAFLHKLSRSQEFIKARKLAESQRSEQQKIDAAKKLEAKTQPAVASTTTPVKREIFEKDLATPENSAEKMTEHLPAPKTDEKFQTTLIDEAGATNTGRNERNSSDFETNLAQEAPKP